MLAPVIPLVHFVSVMEGKMSASGQPENSFYSQQHPVESQRPVEGVVGRSLGESISQ
jgi:hypothetical protein